MTRHSIIAALGDSTTAGTPGFRSPIEAPPHGAGDPQSQFAYWLMRAHDDWTVLNRGVDGQRAHQVRARLARDLHELDLDLVVIIAGVNDIYQGAAPGTVTRELSTMYAMAAADRRVVPVVAGTILPYNTATADANARMREVNEWIRAYAERHPHVAYCDTRAAVAGPDDPDRLVSSPDDLHPSSDGYRLIALALEPVIRTQLVAGAPGPSGGRSAA